MHRSLRWFFQLLSKIGRTPSRDANEVQREKNALTQKLHTHEEEFKLQNETMMRELNEVNKTELLFSIASQGERRFLMRIRRSWANGIMIAEYVEKKDDQDQ